MTDTTDPTAAIEVWARMLCAADVHVHGEDHPTWQQLVGESGSRIRDDYRKAAAWLLPRLTVSAGVAPVDQAALRDRIARALAEVTVGHKAFITVDVRAEYPRADAVLAELPPSVDRAAILREAADLAQVRADGERSLSSSDYDEEAHAARALGYLADHLRALADEAPATDQAAEQRLARIREWVTSDVVTATTEFGNGYRASQRDIRDLIKGRFDNDAANELRRVAGEAQQPETQADCNSGVGWYEVIHPRNATTCIAYAHENGDLYFPEGDDLTPDEFAFAAARGQAHRLVRADDPAAVSQPDGEAATSCSPRPCNAAADELCDNHAQIKYHAEGEHAFCEPGCTEEA